MERWLKILLVFAAMLPGATSCFAVSLSTAGSSGVSWLIQQRNANDGSWGASDPVKYVQTSEAVMALSSLNVQGAAYYGGVAWLSNHAPSNVDFTARRVLALGPVNQSVMTDMQVLSLAQNLAAPGNNGWGLSGNYQGSPLDTALTLQALARQGVTSNVSQAVAYLTASQLIGSDPGWALGQEATSDPVTTAQVLIALIPLTAVSSAVPTAITNGFAALNAKVTTASPASQISLSIIANLRNNPASTQAATLLNALLTQQAADGSWGEDPFATGLALRAVAAGAGVDLTAKKQVVAVPDNALRSAINAALGQGALSAITLGEIQQLTSLNASGLNISNLAGLQYATNLTSLNLSNNKISDFSTVAGLTGTSIDESGNPGYTPPAQSAYEDNDVPTLPQWGEILMAAILLLSMGYAGRRHS